MNDKMNFYYQAIQDTQSTIRAIDVKLGFLFVITFIPITNFTSSLDFSLIQAIWGIGCIYKVLLSIILVSWIGSIIYFFLALTGISDPKKICNSHQFSGLFYGKKIFHKTSYLFGLFVTYKLSNDDCFDHSALSNDNLLNELIYEKIKVNYIREKKLEYYSKGTVLIYIWLFLGLFVFLSYYLFVK